MELIKLKVTDGTVENPCGGSTNNKTKCWAAVVLQDKSAPGGLARTFLKGREGKGIINIKSLRPGDYVEFGRKGMVYGYADHYLYFLVVENTASELILEQVSKDIVGRKNDSAGENSTPLSQALSKIAGLEQKLKLEQEKTAIYRNFLNRLRRKEGKITVEEIGEEVESCYQKIKVYSPHV